MVCWCWNHDLLLMLESWPVDVEWNIILYGRVSSIHLQTTETSWRSPYRQKQGRPRLPRLLGALRIARSKDDKGVWYRWLHRWLCRIELHRMTASHRTITDWIRRSNANRQCESIMRKIELHRMTASHRIFHVISRIDNAKDRIRKMFTMRYPLDVHLLFTRCIHEIFSRDVFKKCVKRDVMIQHSTSDHQFDSALSIRSLDSAIRFSTQPSNSNSFSAPDQRSDSSLSMQYLVWNCCMS